MRMEVDQAGQQGVAVQTLAGGVRVAVREVSGGQDGLDPVVLDHQRVVLQHHTARFHRDQPVRQQGNWCVGRHVSRQKLTGR